MFEMASFREKSNGISHVIWISNKTDRVKRSPEIKVQHTISKVVNHGSDFFTISISDTSEVKAGKRYLGKITINEFEKISNWIILNKKSLLDYWFNNIDSSELSERLSQKD